MNDEDETMTLLAMMLMTMMTMMAVRSTMVLKTMMMAMNAMMAIQVTCLLRKLRRGIATTKQTSTMQLRTAENGGERIEHFLGTPTRRLPQINQEQRGEDRSGAGLLVISIFLGNHYSDYF